MANEKVVATPEKVAVPKVVALVLPKVFTKTGTIVGINERKAGDKFKHDTKIVTMEVVGTNEVIDVFITFNQWKEYNCEKYIYMGNLVTFSLEECIEGKTGYKETSDSVELLAHETSFNAFNRVVETSIVSCYQELSRAGIDPYICKMIMDNINTTRAMFSRTKTSMAEPMQAF
jgi:hypothetical protein